MAAITHNSGRHGCSRLDVCVGRPGRAGDNLNAPLVSDKHVKVHVLKPTSRRDERPGCRPRDRPTPRDGMLRGQDPRGSAGRAVVAERVELTMAAASARCKWEGASQQKNPELRAAYDDHFATKKDIQGTCGERPGLRQQQRSRRGCEVSIRWVSKPRNFAEHRRRWQLVAAIP